MKKIILFGFILILLSSFASALINDAIWYYSFDNSSITTSYVKNDGRTDNQFNGTNINVRNIAGRINEGINATALANINISINSDNSTGSTFALMGWIKRNAVGVTGDGTLYYRTGDNPQIYFSNPDFKLYASGSGIILSNTMNTANQWYHIAIVGDGTNIYFYQDGVLTSTQAKVVPMTTTQSRNIGSFGTLGTSVFQGVIDEFGFYQHNLTQADVTALYNGGTGYNPYTSIPTINASNVLPNNSIQSTNVYINVSANTTYANTNASLYINSTLNETISVGAGTNINLTFNKTITKGSYSIYVKFSDPTYNKTTATSYFSVDSNSVNITIKDETTNTLLYENTSIRFYSSTFGEWTNYTNTSNIYIENINGSEYQLLFTILNTSKGYGTRTYTITISNTSTQNLTAYMPVNVSNTTFTITDRDTAGLLENTLMTMYRNLGGVWVPVESKYSDITGKITFSYLPSANYKFYLSKSGYTDYIFYLNPILFSSYDVSMTRTSTQNIFQDYDGVSIIYAPTSFISGSNTFNFIIQSPYGLLTNYGYNLTYPSNSNATSGTNAIGSQLSTIINITPTSILDNVTLNYYYTTTLYGTRYFSRTYPISYNSSSYVNNTFISNEGNTYGLGIFERVLLATILLIFVVGMASLIGQALAGMLFGLLLFGFFVYIGFLPLWTILLTVTIGLLLIVGRT